STVAKIPGPIPLGLLMRVHFLMSLLLATPLIAMVPAFAAEPPPADIRFQRDVASILSENCFQCHGPDAKARKADLRLDTRAGLMGVLEPGKSSASELVRRIDAAVDDGRMPPPQSKRVLSPEQKQILRRWIDQGAPWSAHWAYEAPTRPSLPAVRDGLSS